MYYLSSSKMQVPHTLKKLIGFLQMSDMILEEGLTPQIPHVVHMKEIHYLQHTNCRLQVGGRCTNRDMLLQFHEDINLLQTKIQ